MIARRAADREYGDPLKQARRAVSTGRFRDALSQLTGLEQQFGSSAEWLSLVAMASWRLGDFEESHRIALRALSAYRARGDADGEMRAQNVAAAGAFAVGRLDEARSGFERAQAIALQFRDNLMMARCANNLGNVVYYQAEHAEALRQYSHAASLFEQVGSIRGMAEAWHNAAVVLREEGDLVAARKATDRALDCASRIADPRMLGWTLGGSGETYALEGDLPLGRAMVERALKLAQDNEDRLTEVDCLRILSHIAGEEDRLDEAIDTARKAADLASDLGNPWMIAKAQQQLANVLSAAGPSSEAAEALEAAAQAFDKMGAESRAAGTRARMRAILD
ncbi:MAG: tetratricopeptide repeat protein [Gemmatimonadales bacterium]